MPPHLAPYAVALPVVALILWRRVSRQFGRQPIRRRAMMLRIAIICVVALVLAANGIHGVRAIGGLLFGLLGGALIGLIGLQLTRFETDPQKGDCYIPNPWIGALIVGLLLVRLGYDFFVLGEQVHPAASALTLGIIGIYLGYYLAYYSGLLIHHRRFQANSRPPAPPGNRV